MEYIESQALDLFSTRCAPRKPGKEVSNYNLDCQKQNERK